MPIGTTKRGRLLPGTVPNDSTSENLTDFTPNWNRASNDQSGWGELFDVSTDPTTQDGYFPLFIENDGQRDGMSVFVLSLEGDTPGVGFTQENYLYSEGLDTTTPTEDFSQFEVNSSSTPSAPRLIEGSDILDTVIIITDVGNADQPPLPITTLDAGNNSFFGTSDIDQIFAGAGDDTLLGGNGNDNLFGEAGADLIDGEAGQDYLNGGSGDDTLKGGEDDDEIDGMGGNDRIEGGSGNDSLYGQSGNDSIFGDSGSDRLNGGIGDDSLFGGSEADALDGGIGNDRMEGGNGDDTYFVDSLGDIIVDTHGTGIETISTRISWSLEINPEIDNLVLTAFGDVGALEGTGNILSNEITGNDLDNRLNGYGTNANNESQFDSLTGGFGSDTFVLGGSWGTSYFESGDGYVVIQDFNWEPQPDSIRDFLEVNGTAGNISLRFRSVGGVGGAGLEDTEVFFTNNNGQRDRIAILSDTTNVDILRDFRFV